MNFSSLNVEDYADVEHYQIFQGLENPKKRRVKFILTVPLILVFFQA